MAIALAPADYSNDEGSRFVGTPVLEAWDLRSLAVDIFEKSISPFRVPDERA